MENFEVWNSEVEFSHELIYCYYFNKGTQQDRRKV